MTHDKKPQNKKNGQGENGRVHSITRRTTALLTRVSPVALRSVAATRRQKPPSRLHSPLGGRNRLLRFTNLISSGKEGSLLRETEATKTRLSSDDRSMKCLISLVALTALGRVASFVNVGPHIGRLPAATRRSPSLSATPFDDFLPPAMTGVNTAHQLYGVDHDVVMLGAIVGTAVVSACFTFFLFKELKTDVSELKTDVDELKGEVKELDVRLITLEQKVVFGLVVGGALGTSFLGLLTTFVGKNFLPTAAATIIPAVETLLRDI